MDWLSLKCPGDFQISWSLAQIKGNNWWRMLLPGRQGKTDRDDWSDPIYASLPWCLGGDVVGFDGSKGTTVNHKGIILFSICLFKKAPSLWVIKIHFRWVYLCWDLSWFSGDRSLRNCDETAIALLQMLNVHWVWHQWCTIFSRLPHIQWRRRNRSNRFGHGIGSNISNLHQFASKVYSFRDT